MHLIQHQWASSFFVAPRNGAASRTVMRDALTRRFLPKSSNASRRIAGLWRLLRLEPERRAGPTETGELRRFETMRSNPIAPASREQRPQKPPAPSVRRRQKLARRQSG